MALLTGAFARPASAASPTTPGVIAGDVGLFALGAAGAFLAHESGHLSANAAMGNRPRLIGVRGLFGAPFVAISPDIACQNARCVGAQGQWLWAGPRARTVIASAGFAAQFLTSEAILSLQPNVLFCRAPLLQGILAFNTALALGYALSCLFRAENAYGDATGIAAHARLPAPLIATALMVPTALDGARALWPASRGLVWASRASKALFFGFVWSR